VPIVPLIVTIPVDLTVKELTAPPVVPLTAFRVMGMAVEAVPTVSVTPSARVVLPRVIAPVLVPPIVELPLMFKGVVARLMTPVPAAVTVPLIVLLEGAVAIIPPVNPTVVDPPPRVRFPVF
jgi:hypothetical protein